MLPMEANQENGHDEQANAQRHIEVPTAYIWEAIYDGGKETLPEYALANEETGEVKKSWFHDIDLPRCTAFVLHALLPGFRDISVKIDHASGQRLIFTRRYPTEYDFMKGETRYLDPIHVIGWQRTIHGVNVSHYTYIFPDGSLLLSDEHNAV